MISILIPVKLNINSSFGDIVLLVSMRSQVVTSSIGKLVSLNVDGRNITEQQPLEIPALMPLSVANDDHGEKTMIWSNLATLFSKTDRHDTDIQEWSDSLTRSTNDILQELQEVKTELAEVQGKQMLTEQVRQIKKYVNKKCDTLRENLTYGTFNADNEIFAYINKISAEMNQRMTQLEGENSALRDEIAGLHNTYDSDYNMFVTRENDLMAQLDAATQLAESANQRVKDCEFTFFRQLQETRNNVEQSQHTMVGDLREEFVHAITREIESEHKTQVDWLQHVHDELVDLVTRSNEYHSHRYFGLAEQVNKTHDTCQDMCQTLKNSIGMVDAELSDTKEKVEFLTEEVAQANNDVYDAKESITDTKDEIYQEMDRDYYDLKDYVKRRVQYEMKQMKQKKLKKQKERQEQNLCELASNVIGAILNPIQVIADEHTTEPHLGAHEDDHIILIDESMFQSDSDEE